VLFSGVVNDGNAIVGCRYVMQEYKYIPR
jgi:hypothetical protein